MVYKWYILPIGGLYGNYHLEFCGVPCYIGRGDLFLCVGWEIFKACDSFFSYFMKLAAKPPEICVDV